MGASIERAVDPRTVEGPDRLTTTPVEASDVTQHAQMLGVEQPAWLRERTASVPGVLEVAAFAPQGPRHVGRLRLDAELVEESHEQGVGRLVIDDEPRIDRPLEGVP